MLNVNDIFDKSLRTMDNFNFTNFLSDIMLGCSTKGASYCCFHKDVSNNFFQKVLLINFISTYANLLQHFIFARVLLIEDNGKCALEKEPVIGHVLRQLFFESLND